MTSEPPEGYVRVGDHFIGEMGPELFRPRTDGTPLASKAVNLKHTIVVSESDSGDRLVRKLVDALNAGRRMKPQSNHEMYNLLILGRLQLLRADIEIGFRRIEDKLSELDDAVARIEADVAQVGPALQALRDEIAALGTTGADVTRLNAAADALETALTPPA